MNADQKQHDRSGTTAGVREPKAEQPGRGPSPDPRTSRAWLGDAPSGDEQGTHVVSRIGVCRSGDVRR